MRHQDDLNAKTNDSVLSDVAKTDQAEPSRKSELSDEQMAKITGGMAGGFPDKGGSGDTSITPVPTPSVPNTTTQ